MLTSIDFLGTVLCSQFPITALIGLAIGCGNGREVVKIKDILPGSDLYGIDLINGFDSKSKEAVHLLAADAKRQPFPSGYFDFVIANHSLEHISGLTSAIAEIWRVLKSQGVLVVGVPNRARWIGYLGAEASAS